MNALPTGLAGADPLARRRSNTELSLLVLAVLVVLCAYTLVGLTEAPRLPAELPTYGGAVAGLGAVAHLVRRRLAPGADPLLLPLAFMLNGLGLVMVGRIDLAPAPGGGARVPVAPAQALWTVVGITVFCATLLALRDHRALDRYRYLIGAGALVALLLPLAPIIGKEVNGARIWLSFGGLLSIQPGEFAKLGIAVFFASYLADKRPLLSVATNRLGPLLVPPARAFGPVLAAWAISLAVLILQKDLGLSLLFFGLFVVMLYMATARPLYVVAATLLFTAGAAFAYRVFGHVRLRVNTWLDPWASDEGYQLAQSLFALGTGGLLGVGLGKGYPEYVPAVETDFIFSAFGEELGLIGTTALLLCYFLVVGRGFTVALRCRDDFGQLLAAGLTASFGLQVFVILGGVTRLIPLTGLTLPFVSYGGSSLVGNYLLVALLLRISAADERVPA